MFTVSMFFIKEIIQTISSQNLSKCSYLLQVMKLKSNNVSIIFLD